jgi:tRNA(fMet)-specific endonuclease VapC
LSYLLDTNACVQIFEATDNPTKRRLERELLRSDIFVSSIVFFQLWYGVYKSARIEANRPRIARLLGMGIRMIPFEEVDAEAAGRIRAVLQTRKQPIGPYDTLIAGQALARDLTLVTANQREFARVDGLLWEDWAQAPA